MTRPAAAALTTGPVVSSSGIVVSPHFLASEAGAEVLRQGGSAIDAAVAVNAMLSVVAPDTCGPGGDLFALVHGPDLPVPRALNASGRAGSGWTSDALRSAGHGEIPYRSPWSITVPGCVDGWEALISAFGNRSLAADIEPAILTATGGFPVSHELAATLERVAPMIGDQESAYELLPDGIPPAEGTTLRRPALAESLVALASGGRDAFYRGGVGAGVTRASDGAVTAADLEHNQADWIDPLHLDVFGRTAWTIPPNSQGYLTLATLWIFEQLDPPDDPNDPLYHHLLIEAYRSVAWERADTVSDPDTARYAPTDLLAPERLASRAARISRGITVRWPMPTPAPGGTAYMTVLDETGLGISLIQSNFAGIGSAMSAGASGVWLHNRGAGFNLIPGHPNEYAPGKRPLHTLSPTLWTADGRLDLLLGTRGGDQQPQFLAQVAAHHYHAGLCIADAQAMPRWSMEQPAPGMDSAVRIEDRWVDATVSGLAARGHSMTLEGSYEAGWGPVSVIDLDDHCRVVGSASGGSSHEGAADPRVTTSAAMAT